MKSQSLKVLGGNIHLSATARILNWRGDSVEDREIRDLFQFYIINPGNFFRIRCMISLPVINFLNAVSTERLHAGRAGHGGGRDQLRLPTAEKAAEIDLRVEHEFLARIPVIPESRRRIVAWSQTIIRRADHPIVKIQRGGPYLPVRVFRTQTGHIGKGHGVLGNGQATG